MSPVAIQDETTMSSAESREETGSQEFAGSASASPTDSVLDSFESISGSENYASVEPKYHSIAPTSTSLRTTMSSDKSTIIRLNDELLKSKRSNWEVVDALSKAYQDLRELRMKEQHFSRALYGEGAIAQKTKDTHANDKVFNFQLELMKEDFLKAKANVVSLTDQRDVLRQSLSHAQSELRLLSFENSRKDSELELARDRIKSVEADARLKIDLIIQSEQKSSLLERRISLKERKLEEVSSERKLLQETVVKRDREIEELKTKLGSQAAEKKEDELELLRSTLERSVRFAQTERMNQPARFEEKDPRLPEERHKMEESLKQLKMKEVEDNKVILDLKAQVRQWERYGARYDSY